METTYRERPPMPPDQPFSSSAMERLVTQEIGVKLTGILKENTPGRICGLLTARAVASNGKRPWSILGSILDLCRANRSIQSFAASYAIRIP
jgi:hypothetical protein